MKWSLHRRATVKSIFIPNRDAIYTAALHPNASYQCKHLIAAMYADRFSFHMIFFSFSVHRFIVFSVLGFFLFVEFYSSFCYIACSSAVFANTAQIEIRVGFVLGSWRHCQNDSSTESLFGNRNIISLEYFMGIRSKRQLTFIIEEEEEEINNTIQIYPMRLLVAHGIRLSFQLFIFKLDCLRSANLHFYENSKHCISRRKTNMVKTMQKTDQFRHVIEFESWRHVKFGQSIPS